MESEYNPAKDPMNGPNRLSLERSPEAKAYDAQDWPGSSSFHPPHINELFRTMKDNAQPENPEDEAPEVE